MLPVAPIRSMLCLVALLASTPALAQADDPAPPGAAPEQTQPPESHDAQDLAKKLSNPVANLISVPFQENIDFGGGWNDQGFKSTLNIQPVIPLHLSENWNLIIRTILPVIYQQDITGPFSHQRGLGDTTQSFFLSPSRTGPGGIVWGVGPVVVYPSATDEALGGGKWGAGATALVLKQAGHNTFGFLTNQVWSVAGDADRQGISALFLQPFFSHTTKSAMTYGLNAEATYNWKTNQWVVPLNLTAAQLTKIGKQPVSIGGGFRYYVEKPEGAPDWGLRLIVTFLFPK